MKLIIYPDVDIWNYVLADLAKREDIMLFPLNRYSSLFQRLIRRCEVGLSLISRFVLDSEIKQAVASLTPADSLLLCEYTEPALSTAIAQALPKGVKAHMWLWNHKGNSNQFRRHFPVAIRNNFAVSTYDEHDAKKYGLRCYSQFFCLQRLVSLQCFSLPVSTDFFFVGYRKNREQEIVRVSELLSSFQCQFRVVQSSEEYIPYSHYMVQAAASRCVVEIMQDIDHSCTLRPLEALALRRKLLTNNSNVRKYAFYHPQNIFILGEDDMNSLSAFLQSPFVPIPEEVIKSYDVNTWVDWFE